MPRGEVACLLVAINNHAHSFQVAAQKERATYGEALKAEGLKVVETWERHAVTLNGLKAEIKRQARIR
jgi:hypothetical protein